MQTGKVNSEEVYKMLFIIWTALLVSQLIFLVMVFFIKPALFRLDFSRPIFGENLVIVSALGVAAISAFVFSMIQRKKLVDQAINEQNVVHIQTALITGCALCESISLLGLVLAFAFDYSYFFIFSAFGILGMFFHLPNRSHIQAASYKV